MRELTQTNLEPGRYVAEQSGAHRASEAVPEKANRIELKLVVTVYDAEGNPSDVVEHAPTDEEHPGKCWPWCRWCELRESVGLPRHLRTKESRSIQEKTAGFEPPDGRAYTVGDAIGLQRTNEAVPGYRQCPCLTGDGLPCAAANGHLGVCVPSIAMPPTDSVQNEAALGIDDHAIAGMLIRLVNIVEAGLCPIDNEDVSRDVREAKNRAQWLRERAERAPGMRDALVELCSAIERARDRHPEGSNLAALISEVGEVATAMLRESPSRIRSELLDVAVVAVRLWLGERAPEATW